MEKGIDYSDIIDNSFYTKTYIQNQILGRALLESVLFYDGKCIFSLVTQDEMNFYGVTGRELGGIVEQLRLTEGVEVAIPCIRPVRKNIKSAYVPRKSLT